MNIYDIINEKSTPSYQIRNKISIFFEHCAKYMEIKPQSSHWIASIHEMYDQLNEANGNSKTRNTMKELSEDEFTAAVTKGLQDVQKDNKNTSFNSFELTKRFNDVYDCMNSNKVLKLLNDYNNDPDPKRRDKIKGSINNYDWTW